MWFMRKLLHGRTEKLLTQSFQKQMKTVYVLDKLNVERQDLLDMSFGETNLKT